MEKYENLIKRYDKGNMLKLLRNFPQQFREAIKLSNNFNLEKMKEKTYENIFIQGMGGSGISGFLARDLLGPLTKLPIVVNNSYELPGFVGRSTLAFFVSYSGNTEETLACFKKARRRNASIVCVSSNGKLARMCKNCIKIPPGNPPRTMLAFLSVPILAIASRLKILKKSIKLDTVPTFLEKNAKEVESLGQNLAIKLKNKIPVIYASDSYASVALRFHAQLAENAGTFSHWNVLPEANHNEIVGFKPKENFLAFVFLRSRDESMRMRKRFEFTKKIVSNSYIEVWLKGKTHAERMFYGIWLGDFASYYLALFNKKDPSSIENIVRLKTVLSR